MAARAVFGEKRHGRAGVVDGGLHGDDRGKTRGEAFGFGSAFRLFGGLRKPLRDAVGQSGGRFRTDVHHAFGHGADDEQILLFERGRIFGIRHGEVQGRHARRRRHAADGVQEGREFNRTRVLAHDRGRPTQVRVHGEGEGSLREESDLGELRIVVHPGEFDHRRGIDLHLMRGEGRRTAVFGRAFVGVLLIARFKGEVVHKAESPLMQGARRHGRSFGDGQIHDGSAAAFFVGEVLTVGEGAVYEGAKLRGLTRDGLRVAVKKIQSRRRSAREIGVRSKSEGDVKGRQRFTAGRQLFGVFDELAQGHREVGVHPVGRHVGGKRIGRLEVLDRGARSDEDAPRRREGLRGRHEVGVGLARDDEHLFIESTRGVEHEKFRSFKGCQFPQKRRTVFVRCENDEVTLGGNFREIDREVGASPGARRGDAARHDGGGAKGVLGRSRSEDHGERRRLFDRGVDKRQRELRQVVRQAQVLLFERQLARRRNVEPERAVSFVFAHDRVVPDEFDAQLIARLHGLRVERDREARGLAEHFLRDRGDALKFSVEVDVQLRGPGNQRGRGRKREVERRLRNDFVRAHAEVEVLRRHRARKLHRGGESSGDEADEVVRLGDGGRRVGAPHGRGRVGGEDRLGKTEGERKRGRDRGERGSVCTVLSRKEGHHETLWVAA